MLEADGALETRGIFKRRRRKAFISTPESFNDGAVTVKLQQGKFTDKVWSRLKNQPDFNNSSKANFEFNPRLEIPYSSVNVNHRGIITRPEIFSEVWKLLDLPPRGFRAKVVAAKTLATQSNSLDALENLTYDEIDQTTIMFPTSKDNLPLIKERIGEFRRELAAEFTQDEKNFDSIYQFCFSALPLTKNLK